MVVEGSSPLLTNKEAHRLKAKAYQFKERGDDEESLIAQGLFVWQPSAACDGACRARMPCCLARWVCRALPVRKGRGSSDAGWMKRHTPNLFTEVRCVVWEEEEGVYSI